MNDIIVVSSMVCLRDESVSVTRLCDLGEVDEFVARLREATKPHRTYRRRKPGSRPMAKSFPVITVRFLGTSTWSRSKRYGDMFEITDVATGKTRRVCRASLEFGWDWRDE